MYFQQEHRGLLTIRYPMEHGIVKDWNDMERIWQYIYSKDQLQTFSEEVLFNHIYVCFGSAFNIWESNFLDLRWLAKLWQRLKWAFLIKKKLTSIIIIVNFLHFHLLQNQWANLKVNISWHKIYMYDVSEWRPFSLFKWIAWEDN